VVHVTVSLVLAWLGYGAMSMAWANFASIVSYGLIAAALRGSGVPLTPSFSNTKRIFSFGSISSLGSVANVAGTNSPDVIIGKAISLAATGYFSRGNGLVQMFKTLVSGALVPLVLPYFSQLRREQKDMVAPYRMAIAHLSGFAWPFYAVMALLALPTVRTLYGDNWDVSVPVVRILCLAGAISTLSTFAGEVMIAYGHIKVVTKLHLLNQPVRIVAVLVGSMYGLEAIAFGLVIAECVALATTSHYLYRTNGVRLSGVLSATFKSALLTACSMIGPLLVVLVWPPNHHEFLQCLVGGIGALCGWLGAVIWSGHPIREHLQQAQVRFWPAAPWSK
jgi:O-antigen/teichoic acid export membrane protein